MTFKADGPTLRFGVEKLLADAGLDHQGLVDENEFIKILIHGSAYRFGVAIEMTIEAIGEPVADHPLIGVSFASGSGMAFSGGMAMRMPRSRKVRSMAQKTSLRQSASRSCRGTQYFT